MMLRLPHRLLAAAVAGVLGQTAFPQTVFAPGGFLGIVALLWLLRDIPPRQGALIGAVFGVAFFGPMLAWLGPFGWYAVVALAASQAAWLAGFGWLAAWGRWGRREPGGAFQVAVWFAAIELARATVPLGGFEWGSLGYSGGDTLGNLAAFGGVRLVSLWMVLEAALLFSVVRCLRRPILVAIVAAYITPTLAGVLPIGVGAEREPFEVAIVQGSGPEERLIGLPRRGRVGPEDEIIVRQHLRQTATISSEDAPDLVIWPENAYDRDPADMPELFAETLQQVRRLGVPFLVGAITDDADGKQRNTNLLVTPQGITDQVAKRHLVPFGEFVPWGWPRRVLPILEEYLPGDLAPGEGPGVVTVDGVTIGSAICFESTYARDIRRIVADGAEIIVVSTNNASYGRSKASRQHLEMSRMRAREHGKPVVQAAITGISAFIMPDGRILQATDHFAETVIRQGLRPVQGRTWYARFGRMLEIALFLLAVGMILHESRYRRSKP